MTRFLTLMAVCAAISLISGTGFAADQAGRLAADADKDGKVTAAEREGFAKTRFTAMDTDKDGQITDKDVDARLKEVKAKNPNVPEAELLKRNARIKAHFAGMDSDKSKGVSLNEFLARGKNLTAAADTDKDGAISAAEMKAYRNTMRAKKAPAE